MKKRDPGHLKKQFLTLREELFEEIRQKNMEASLPLDEGVADFGDQGVAGSLRDLLHLLSDSKREELIKIDEALDRLDEGSYGQCTLCKLPIEEGRLAVRPYTRHCIACKKAIEERRQKIEPERGQI